MRIGIDCRTILNPDSGESAGVGHYTYFLVKHLLRHDQKNEYVLFFDYRMDETDEFNQRNVKVQHFAYSQYKKFLPFTYSHMLITAMLLRARLDVFHSPANVVPLTYRKKSILTVHDLAIYKNPGWFPTQIFSTKLLVPQSLKTATHIIAVSESTKHDLKEIFGVPSRKVSVIYEAPFVTTINVKDKNVDVMSKFKLTQPFILYVGAIDARKNLENLLEAFMIVRKTAALQEVKLVLAGNKGYKHQAVFDRVKELHLDKYVQYLGYVTHNEKLGLFRKASLFAFPSLYEGFGLPVLEAMKMGVPVVTSNTSSLPEIADGAAVLVNPEDPKALAAALCRALTNPAAAESLVKRGLHQAEKFTWERAAAETFAVYEKVGRTNTHPKRKQKK